MKKIVKQGNILVIALTIILFLIALFLQGFTHDLLLEAGVLLVSIKLILMNYKSSKAYTEMLSKLDEMGRILNDIKNKK